jgi:hypothetical protein
MTSKSSAIGTVKHCIGKQRKEGVVAPWRMADEGHVVTAARITINECHEMCAIDMLLISDPGAHHMHAHCRFQPQASSSASSRIESEDPA